MEAKSGKSEQKKRRAIIIVRLVIGFSAIEFPGIFFVMDKVEPFIFGLPFLYGYIFCWWLYLCTVFFYAYKTGWGKNKFFRNSKDR